MEFGVIHRSKRSVCFPLDYDECGDTARQWLTCLPLPVMAFPISWFWAFPWEAFQDIQKHRHFNTNNLWIHLPALQRIIAQNKGVMPVNKRAKRAPTMFANKTTGTLGSIS
jgi:hypothetical protein